ncbi:MAG: pyruvate formate lyase family protein, partial [Candidatus Hodarchaeales archaeon]
MSTTKPNDKMELRDPKYQLAQSHGLSQRSKWLRDYYFMGLDREWNNEYTSFTTGIPGDRLWAESDYYIVPETYFYMGTNDWGIFSRSLNLMAHKVPLPNDFWKYSLPERRMLFFEEVMLNMIPQEIIGPDLIAGARFNTQLSKCLTKKEQKQFNKRNLEIRKIAFDFHNYGFGNTGATSGHLIADYETVVKKGFKFLYEKARLAYEQISEKEKQGSKGEELRAMLIAIKIPKKLAEKYAEECKRLLEENDDPKRITELEMMIKNLEIVPWEPAQTFWQGMQSIWLTHMLIMAEESYPGPGVSFGRID